MKCPVNLKAFYEGPRRRNVEDRLGHEGARQCSAVLRRPAWQAAHGRQKGFEAHELDGRNKELVAPTQWAKLRFESREQFLLKGIPIVR